MGREAAAAIYSFMADLSFVVTALLALGVFISGILILTGIGGKGIQQHVRGAFLSIFLGALFCFGANRYATKLAADFKSISNSTPAGTTPGQPGASARPVVTWVEFKRAA